MWERRVRNEELREKLAEAFGRMRKMKLIARQNFSCCGGCAGYEIATDVAKMPAERRERVRGIVFYTRQDGERLRNGAEGVYLAFGDVECSGVGTFGLPTVEVGRLVADTCRSSGLVVEWEGVAEKKVYARVQSEEERGAVALAEAEARVEVERLLNVTD